MANNSNSNSNNDDKNNPSNDNNRLRKNHTTGQLGGGSTISLKFSPGKLREDLHAV